MAKTVKTAVITGVTGQDGSFLAEFLLAKGYRVVGMVSANHNPMGNANIAHLKNQLILEEGDLLDGNSIKTIVAKIRPDEVYNLAGITFVPQAWERPTLTFDINLLGVTRFFEAMAQAKLTQTRFFQASSAEMFGQPAEFPQTETTPLNPVNLYGVSKLAAHQFIRLIRAEENIFAVSGILFYHGSIRRPEQFVIRKITRGAAAIKLGLASELRLGDLEAGRDFGFAGDYVEAMWLALQQAKPDDYVIATGKLQTVRNICEVAFHHLGLDYQEYVRTDPDLLRKNEAKALLGDATKAKTVLGWQPKTAFATMIKDMVDYDVEELARSGMKETNG